ncbi:MAG: hypothetical protein ABIN01_18905 [Ferruginibacter sp.]
MRNAFFLHLTIFLFSCDNKDSNADIATADTTFVTAEPAKSSFENPVPFKNLIWSPVYDSAKGSVVLKQQRPVNADTLTADKLINEINTSWEGIQLEFRKISHDTIYVAIPQSTVLTQQMGSSGAYSYMFSTTFTLTELKNIKFVNYDFVEGDHLAPGTMKRADFKN